MHLRMDIAIFWHDHFAFVIGRDAAHLIVAGRHYRNRLLGAIDVGKLHRNLANTRQALVDNLRSEMIEFQ